MQSLGALRLQPRYAERVWGGRHLKPDSTKPVGESWIIYEEERVLSGPLAGRTLSELAQSYGPDLLGSYVVEKTGARFPLLIKLLDCQAWLSLQVHPNDEQAERLEGPGHFGKTEAWYVLHAEPGAQLISGVKPGVSNEALEHAIREGTVVELTRYLTVHDGDVLITRAGTLHALGPGLLVYEVQQSSDLTYRIFDWNRPQSEGRKLHIEQSISVSNPAASGEIYHSSPLGDGDRQQLVTCPYFTLDLLGAKSIAIHLDTQGATFHALTVTEGEMEMEGDGWRERLGQYETVLVPACCGSYTLHPRGRYRALLARPD
ncbi:MAG: class I mannose-6-phosphate isomerase [Chloroflexi bacterium]|nr:class I mannose-6-phosphate isomerase [Chloroflexota bacterium]